ncbi:hypothetical protein EON82_03485 [bacterium]|nr:MAG: hypothetical protein EON82_03485 [bacterium]
MGFPKNVLISAGIATVATTFAAALLGRRETGSYAAPLNATSHIAFGDEAADQDDFTIRYTATGVVINALAMVSWAAIQEYVAGKWARQGPPVRALAAGTATSAVAYVTDYHVVPERLTPGFEKRLSNEALAIVYGVLAVGLALGIRSGK